MNTRRKYGQVGFYIEYIHEATVPVPWQIHSSNGPDAGKEPSNDLHLARAVVLGSQMNFSPPMAISLVENGAVVPVPDGL